MLSKYLNTWVTVKFSWKSNYKTSPGVLSNKIHIWKTLLVSKLKYFEAIGKNVFSSTFWSSYKSVIHVLFYYFNNKTSNQKTTWNLLKECCMHCFKSYYISSYFDIICILAVLWAMGELIFFLPALSFYSSLNYHNLILIYVLQ